MDEQIEPLLSNNSNRSSSNNVNNENGTVISSTLSLINTIIGTGLLTLPYALSCTGTPLGIFLLIISAYITKQSLVLLIETSKIIAPYSKDLSLSSLSEMMSMPKFGMFIDAILSFNGFGIASSYLIASSDFILSLLKNYISESGNYAILLDRKLWITMEMFIVTPLIFKKKLSSLRYFSFFSVCAISYLAFSIIYSYFTLGVNKPEDGQSNNLLNQTIEYDTILDKIQKIFIAIPVIIFAFTCQQNLFPIYSELKTIKRSSISKIILNAVSFCTIIYLIVAYCGYATIGDSIQGNILNSYPSSMITINIARIAMAIYCIFSYAIQMHPCQESIKNEIISYKLKHQKKDEQSNELIDNGENQNNQENSNINNEKYDDNEEEEEEEEEENNESEIDENDADDERSSDSHQIKHINIDILDNLTCPVLNNNENLNNYDDERIFRYITISLLFLSYLLSMSIDDLGKILGIVGATASTILTFILPGYLYTKLTRGLTFNRFKAILLLILGVIIGIIGTISVLLN